MKLVDMATKREPDDPIGEAYAKVRDAVRGGDIPAGMAIAILELVKMEMLANMQDSINERLNEE